MTRGQKIVRDDLAWNIVMSSILRIRSTEHSFYKQESTAAVVYYIQFSHNCLFMVESGRKFCVRAAPAAASVSAPPFQAQADKAATRS